MDSTCEGPTCTNPVTQLKTGRRRCFCSAVCRKAAFNLRHNEIVWEPLDAAVVEHVPVPTPTPNPDDAVAGAIVDLGRAADIGRIFAGFQEYLYQPQAAA